MEMFKEKFSKAMTEFIESSRRNQWVESHPMQMYVRRSTRLVCGRPASVLDVANVQVESMYQGKGYFKTAIGVVLELAKGYGFDAVMIESVINNRFEEHFATAEGWDRYSVGCDENVNYIYKYA